MKIKAFDMLFAGMVMVGFIAALVGVMVYDGVQARPFKLIAFIDVVVLFYLAFRVEFGEKLK